TQNCRHPGKRRALSPSSSSRRRGRSIRASRRSPLLQLAAGDRAVTRLFRNLRPPRNRRLKHGVVGRWGGGAVERRSDGALPLYRPTTLPPPKRISASTG